MLTVNYFGAVGYKNDAANRARNMNAIGKNAEVAREAREGLPVD